MKIHTLALERVNGFLSAELNFVDLVTGKARPRTVIAGSNGSGKTTILETICELLALAKAERLGWVAFDNGYSENSNASLTLQGLLSEQDPLLRIEINEKWLPGNSPAALLTLAKYGIVSYTTAAPQLKQNVKGQDDIKLINQIEFLGNAQQIPDYIEHPARLFSRYSPNCLYFPSEGRRLQPKAGGQISAETDVSNYAWVYRFADSDQWPGSLESFLVAMYFRDLMAQLDNSEKKNGQGTPSDFKRLIKIINSFFTHKQITGVDRQSFRIQVEAEDKAIFNIDKLSSGEKQVFLLLAEIQRRIRQGSILLIDEPEIHLHPRWQRLLMRALTELCAEYDAQLIIATHSPEIADSVYEHELILLDDIFEQNEADTNQSSPPEPTPELTV